MQVFWPDRNIDRTAGDVVGCRMDDTLCVVGIVQDWHTKGPHDLRALQKVGTALPISDRSPGPSSPAIPVFWVNKDSQPAACSQPIELIFYTPPDTTRLRFLRLSPRTDKHVRRTHSEELMKQDEYGISSRTTLASGSKLDTTEEVIDLINRSQAAQGMISGRPAANLLTASQKRTGKIQPRPAKGTACIVTLVLAPVALLARTVLNAASAFHSIRNSSLTVNQLCLRLAQAADAPEKFKSTREVICKQERSKRYISFWNTVWLVLNDIILGYCARQLILLSAHSIHDWAIRLFSTYLVEVPTDILQWLNDWPVGLKLNTPLSQFFCTSLGLVIGHWGAHIEPLLHTYGFAWIHLIAWTSLGGLTFTLAILNDLLSLLTLHLSVCHVLMRLIYKWQLDSLGGLWNLFRGKRWNVLRQRTDSYAYDVDQLFLGTLLFTVSAFLFPTVSTYAALFATIRTALLLAKKSITYAVDALNAFPLFELLLRMKESSRLPAGVHFKLRPLPNERELGRSLEGRYRITHAWDMKNSPKTFSDIIQLSSPAHEAIST
ncbi:hypothetical protein IAU59_000737 [Kwoniella sp. CBS 9459]